MSSERSIPHLRDIFGLNGYTPHNNNNNHQIINNNNNSLITNNNNNNNNITHKINNNNGDTGGSVVVDVDVKKQSRKKRDNSKTLTSGDVKTLERHLSMKKTIRKKIMRDLQQAFVDDPNEFKVENTNSEQMRAELKAETIRFGENPSKKSDNFLVMLRGNEHQQQQQQQKNNNSYDYPNNNNQGQQQMRNDYDSTQIQNNNNNTMNKDEKQSFWKRFTMKNKNKR